MYDVAVVGGGIAGMATAARLQASGLTTVVFEAHGRVGGCAGYFRRRGFAFDVGATTLVDFQPGGVGAELLNTIDLTLDGEALPGYVAWLPDRNVTLHRNSALWHVERLEKLGTTPNHRHLWEFLDTLARVFWQASRQGIALPIRNVDDLWRNMQSLGLANLPLAPYLNWTMGDALRKFNLRHDKPLCALLAMLIEDTVHSTLDDAPLINAALGITIRGAGLMRHRGGMMGFWQLFANRYRELGGHMDTGCAVQQISGHFGDFTLQTQRGIFQAAQVVSAVPATITSRIAPAIMEKPLRRYIQRDADSLGGAVVVFLGVPDHEVEGQNFTHHQLLQSYDLPLGNGNNMFISVSASDDRASAPPGCRAVMISTHCDLSGWKNLTPRAYDEQKCAIGDQLLNHAHRVYPELGRAARVYEIGTPRTYAAFTGRPEGAIGGVRQTLLNTNQNAVPNDVGPGGFWMVGDSTWPGLGTVACVLGSRHVADAIIKRTKTFRRSTYATANSR